MPLRSEAIPVVDGVLETTVLGPEDARDLPGLVVVPSIHGPAPDLVARLSEFEDSALVAAPDPFWRVGGGVVPYEEHAAAIGRLRELDFRRCIDDLAAVVDWTAERCNGRVVGLGICFGGPFVLRFAAEQRLAGVVTWHGSRMQEHLARASEIRCPLRLHFGAVDPITPPEVVASIEAAFAQHPDASIVVHPNADHGFSHDGACFDPAACRAGLDAVGELLANAARR